MVPKAVINSGSRLTGYTRHGQYDACDDTGESSRYDHAKGGTRLSTTQCKRGLTLFPGYQEQHILGGACNDRDHDDAQRDSARKPREALLGYDDQHPGEEPENDGGHTGQQIDQGTDHVRQASPPKFRQIDGGEDAQRDADKRCQPHQDDRALDGRSHAPARLSIRRGQLE